MGDEGFVNEPIDVSEAPASRRELALADAPELPPRVVDRKRDLCRGDGSGRDDGCGIVQSRPWIPLLVMAIMLSLTAVTAVLKVLEVRNIGYQVRDHDLSYRSGVLVKTVETVPFVRVQHARISQGPIQRSFGLATLEVNSAGPDLQIHGLPAEDAERLKVVVVERAGDLAEEL